MIGLLGYFMQVLVSAPGKIHLLGEHTVVYGKPAILAAIDRRIYVKITNYKLTARNASHSDAGGQITNEGIKINTSENDRLVKEAIKIFKKAFSRDKLSPIEITITSQIPTGSGLGSSGLLRLGQLGL